MVDRYRHYGWLLLSILTIGGSCAAFVPFGRYLTRLFPEDEYLIEKVFLLLLSVILFGFVSAFASWMTWPRNRTERGESESILKLTF